MPDPILNVRIIGFGLVTPCNFDRLPGGTTVRKALQMAEVNFAGLAVQVNGNAASLDTVLPSNSTITGATAVKGA